MGEKLFDAILASFILIIWFLTFGYAVTNLYFGIVFFGAHVAFLVYVGRLPFIK